MKIIILGGGHVGGTLAENLVNEDNDITVIDRDPAVLSELASSHDIRTVEGDASHPRVLRNAGCEDADMIIAVTPSDETNMLACQIAYTLFRTPKRIARIRSEEYIDFKDQLFHKDDMPVDHLISPEQQVTLYIKRLVDYPGALQVMEFAGGRASLVAVKAYYGGRLVGHAISSLKDHMPDIDTRVAAIFRKGQAIKPMGTTIIEAGDEVFFITDTRHVRTVMEEMQRLEHQYRRIMIAGGGNIGAGLARLLESDHQIKLIEQNHARAEKLNESLRKTTILQGDASDKRLLIEEHIEDIDVFIAVTNDDEANIMAAMLAKKLGAKKTMVLIQRQAYVDLVQDDIVDIAISPQRATVSALLALIRKGDIVNAYSLRKGAAEAIEAIAHGDEKTSKVIGKAISEIKLPPGTTIGAIVRGNEVLIAHDDTILHADDHVILFLVDKKYIREVERLFQPSALFF
ncbi:potassium transporter peripheral membrane component [Pseudidiomarina salinarum]|uniref:Trk system potassium uptake protein TrkA n=1 Tax=Pseudidiomarina salinarum TaxID=435908 RepID=A0A094L7Z7_9GAMM|nr:Trk system potassium transporter TrkA [Pseudidiomarina salinarum]KFZ30898.1 potassium transporter peripheral membrane component [Pseudidiomarina salinarum]RUO71379.1 Trk system potassium transporter TrkA [Pseudidiomarina salinarum]